MTTQLREYIELFQDEYLNTPAGQKHLAITEAEPAEVKAAFADIKQKHERGKDITDDVLRRLLPHQDTEYHRENDYRISTWPTIRKDVRGWFEGAGWKEPEDWPPTAHLLFEALDGVLHGDIDVWRAFLESEYRHGFGTGFISPILFCLDDERFVVINSKVIKTYKYCTEQLGEPDEIDAKLAHYLVNAKKVKALQERLEPLGLRNIREFDIFCHFMVSKRLGGGDLTKEQEPQYAAWLFVANPDIFRWEEAFENQGVEWTGSLGSYPQKLLRRQVKAGDRVFGYQAGPDYEVRCELEVSDKPYKTSEGTWAARLFPVRFFESSISLSMIKAHPVLSTLTFVQQPQASITGITDEQLAALEGLVQAPEAQVVSHLAVSEVDQVCKELREAQYDTVNSSRYEAALAEAFELLGFEVEHLGGPGKADVLVTAQVGSESYTAVIEAKTCQKGAAVGLGQINYASINDHQEENTADYALLIAAEFTSGKVMEHARRNVVKLVRTEALISVLKRHDQFPFSMVELRRLFEGRGLVENLEREMGRVHNRHYEYLQLAGEVLRIFDDLQRKMDVSEPISSRALYFILLNGTQRESLAAPNREQIEEVMSLLSNPCLEILTKTDGGYALMIAPAAARKRLLALADVLTVER